MKNNTPERMVLLMAIVYKIDVLKELKDRGYNTSRLRKEKIMGEATIQKIREKQLASWATIDTICSLLECNVGDVVEYVKDAGEGVQ
jgi:putative transcriptional regulator